MEKRVLSGFRGIIWTFVISSRSWVDIAAAGVEN